MIGTLCCHAQSLPHNAAYHSSVGQTPFVLNSGFQPRTPPADRLEDVHPASAAFVERWQAALAFARRCLIAVQQRQKVFADQRREEKVFLCWGQGSSEHEVP